MSNLITINIKLKEGRYVTLCDSSTSPITCIFNWLDFNKIDNPLSNNYITKAIVFLC
ncbi:hypothetical protein BN1326_60322 [Staphylococcus argenteus]|uniref:Uncharacterized protein n=1 Tax=Staphylococcus argenteus TaxID=985002 RepID=A0A7U7PYD8_9STAP|nr:hypothetical protein BN1326_60322 [Staphylococcus argenteus]CRI26566.1 hypothetical protein BN1326_60322 [Staphylococcus argenteus]